MSLIVVHACKKEEKCIKLSWDGGFALALVCKDTVLHLWKTWWILGPGYNNSTIVCHRQNIAPDTTICYDTVD